MVKKYVYGRPFETYAVVNAENVSDAAESEKRGFFREADMKKALVSRVNKRHFTHNFLLTFLAIYSPFPQCPL